MNVENIDPEYPCPQRCSKAGFSLVELLVVGLIVVMTAISVGRMISMMLAIEQKFLQEADVMEKQADNLAYVERYFSLAENVTDQTAVFRLETGGVAFETSHWLRVSGFAAQGDGRSLLCEINSTDARKANMATNRLSAYGRIQNAAADITEVKVDGNPGTGMRRVRLIAHGCSGALVITNDRPVRLWNHF